MYNNCIDYINKISLFKIYLVNLSWSFENMSSLGLYIVQSYT